MNIEEKKIVIEIKNLDKLIDALEEIAKAIETVCNDAKIAELETNIEKMGKPNAASEIANAVLMLADAYMEKETRRKKENLK